MYVSLKIVSSDFQSLLFRHFITQASLYNFLLNPLNCSETNNLTGEKEK